MRSGVALLALILVALALPSPALATTWEAPIALPAARPPTAPGPVLSDGAGNVIAVSFAGGSYDDPFTLRIDSVVRGRPGTPALLRDWQLLDTAPDRGGLLVLMHRVLDPLSDAGRVALVRIAFGDAHPSVRPRWSAPGLPSGTVTATAAGRTVVWLDRAGRAQQTNVDRGWHGARALPLPVPRADGSRGVSTAMDLASDGHGGSILALTSVRTSLAARAGTLVVADARAGGRLAVRQRVTGLSGDPELVRGPTGRVGLLLSDDGGISGGDCEGSGHPRRLWAAVRDAGSPRFHAPRRLLTSNRVCYQPGQHLTAGPDGRFAVAWGVGYMLDSEPSTLWLSTASPTGSFGRPAALSRNLLLSGAGYDSAGTLSIAASRRENDSSAYVVQRRPVVGLPGPFAPLASSSEADLAASDLSLHPAAFFGDLGGLRVQLGRNP